MVGREFSERTGVGGRKMGVECRQMTCACTWITIDFQRQRVLKMQAGGIGKVKLTERAHARKGALCIR